MLLTFQFSTAMEYVVCSWNLLKFFRQLSIIVLVVSCEQRVPESGQMWARIWDVFGIDLDHWIFTILQVGTMW